MFPSLITQFLSLITQKWWVPWSMSLFGFVFWICFIHSILTYLSNELQKLETSFRCFWVMEIEIRWHFRNFTQLMEPTFYVLSNPCQPTPQQLFSLSLPDLFFALFFDFLCSSSSQATHHNFVSFFFLSFSPFHLLPFFLLSLLFLFHAGLFFFFPLFSFLFHIGFLGLVYILFFFFFFFFIFTLGFRVLFFFFSPLFFPFHIGFMGLVSILFFFTLDF